MRPPADARDIAGKKKRQRLAGGHSALPQKTFDPTQNILIQQGFIF
jgi:hypothetical protein